jgi:hypothetical protein
MMGGLGLLTIVMIVMMVAMMGGMVWGVIAAVRSRMGGRRDRQGD